MVQIIPRPCPHQHPHPHTHPSPWAVLSACSRDGFVSNAGAAVCSACPMGTFKAQGAANTCLPCPAGERWCLAVGASSLRPASGLFLGCAVPRFGVELVCLRCHCRPQAVGPTLLPQPHHAHCVQQVSVCCAPAPLNLRAAASGSHHSGLPAVLPAPCALRLPSLSLLPAFLCICRLLLLCASSRWQLHCLHPLPRCACRACRSSFSAFIVAAIILASGA